MIRYAETLVLLARIPETRRTEICGYASGASLWPGEIHPMQNNLLESRVLNIISFSRGLQANAYF